MIRVQRQSKCFLKENMGTVEEYHIIRVWEMQEVIKCKSHNDVWTVEN